MKPRRILCALALLLAIHAVSPGAARGADSFYTDLLSRGSQAYSRGQFDDATRLLRIACFGFLDEPPLLLEGLVRLSLARSATGDLEGFREAFGRIADLEARFGTYSNHQVAEELIHAFENEVRARIPSADQQLLPLAPRSTAAIGEDLEQLPVRQRRAELRKRAAADPDDLRWPLALAQLETDEGRHRQALRWLAWLRELDPANQAGLCLRGRNLAETGECGAAPAMLAACQESLRDVRLGAAHLKCLVKNDDWTAAAETVASHPATFRGSPDYAKLAERVEARVGGEIAQPETVSVPAAVGPEPTQAAQAVEPAAAPAESEGVRLGVRDSSHLMTDRERDVMRVVRETLATARSRQDLEVAEQLAAGLAEAHPGVQEVQFLAGELAYRAGDWEQVVQYLRKAGEPDETRSHLMFYLAVALYETGDRSGANRVLTRALPHLPKTPFVRGYEERITGRSRSSD